MNLDDEIWWIVLTDTVTTGSEALAEIVYADLMIYFDD